MSSRFPIWRRQDSGSNAAILENEKTLGTRLPDNHAVHAQTRDHGLYGWSRFPSPAKTWSQFNWELMSVSGLNRSRLTITGADQIWWAFRGVYTQFSKSPCLSPPPKQLFIFYTSSLCRRRCEAATNCHSGKDSKIMPPKSLDSDSTRVPKVSRATDAKRPSFLALNVFWIIKHVFLLWVKFKWDSFLYCASVLVV